MSSDRKFSETLHLFQSAKSGDHEAIRDLIVKYQDKIHKLARIRLGKKLRSKMDSMDIVQDAMLKALESLDNAKVSGEIKTFSSEVEFEAWLYSIVKTRIVDEFRHYDADKRRLSKELQLDATGGYLTVDRTVAGRRNPAAQLEDMMLLESFLDQLEEVEREIFIERDLHELSFKEMAKKYGKTEDAMRMQYNRVKIKLAAMVKDE